MRVLYWRTELVEPRPSDTERSILPDDFAMVVHEQDAVVDAGGRAGRTRARWDAGAGHQSETTDALGVISADNSGGANVRGASSELPHDVASRIDFDDAIVELIGDEDVARMIEFLGTLHLRDSHRNKIALAMKIVAAMSPK